MARLTGRDDDADTAAEAAREIERLREAIIRLSNQDATLSVHGGSVTVIIDASLTDAELEAIEFFAAIHADDDPPHEYAATLRNLLDRLA
jgi:hypothetical protein